MRQNYPIENPRKFSEKIALHTHKQRQEIAEFDAVMRDLRSDLYREPPPCQTPLPTINSFELFRPPHQGSFHHPYSDGKTPLNVMRRSLPGKYKIPRNQVFHKQSDAMGRYPPSEFYGGERTHSDPFLKEKLHQNMYTKREDGGHSMDYPQSSHPFMNQYFPPSHWTQGSVNYSYPPYSRSSTQYYPSKPNYESNKSAQEGNDESFIYYRPVHDSGVYEPPPGTFQPHMMGDSFEDYSNPLLFRNSSDYYYHNESANRDSSFSNVTDSFPSKMENESSYDFYGLTSEDFLDMSRFPPGDDKEEKSK